MQNNQWTFIDDKGSFRWENPEAINELYFPLCNHSGFMSSITPTLHGDIKQDHHHFVLAPVSVNDLHNAKSARNFWCHIEGIGAWSATGNSAKAHMDRFNNNQITRTIEAGLLWHKMIYTDPTVGLSAAIVNFVPANADQVELMSVTLCNISANALSLRATSAIPLYGRSADNQRDHRHVTSLVNRIVQNEMGITLQPVILFDETGHKMNHTQYFVLGCDDMGNLSTGSIPSQEDFVGCGGDLEWPEAIVKNKLATDYTDTNLDGKECVGALTFDKITLQPGESKTYLLMIGMQQDSNDLTQLFSRYNSLLKFNEAFIQNETYWVAQSNKAQFGSGLNSFAPWMKWVQIQPLLRKIYGCSFLPYHDYGKGGRGWRDLWQDLLSLILLEPQSAKELLLNNFGGIRLDGSNATIIGNGPGEFIADRNNIPRVWMDHGAWPFLTTSLYIHQSGDLPFLLENKTYFKDRLTHRAKKRDENFQRQTTPVMKTTAGELYQGPVIEHLLVQHLTAFFNVGEHNRILLEGADWNDTLDMARTRGESVAFTAFYASNFLSLGKMLRQLQGTQGIQTITIFKELLLLIDSKQECHYDSVSYKQGLLTNYCDSVAETVSGDKISVSIDTLIEDCEAKGQWLFNDLRDKEWIKLNDEAGFFNGYYNNDGDAVDGIFGNEVRMNLTGQVFTTMFGLATDAQVKSLFEATSMHLKDSSTQGYKLNTPLGPNTLNFGRGFSFAYGEKENGAIFSHMVIMFMNALYQRNFVKEAYEVFDSMFHLSLNTEKSKIYPGIPEYFSLTGKGMYHYLTGSASWLFLTVLNEMYGVKGHYGDFLLSPRLMASQFDEFNCASVTTHFDGIPFKITYHNPLKLDYQDWTKMTLHSDFELAHEVDGLTITINKKTLNLLSKEHLVTLHITIG